MKELFKKIIVSRQEWLKTVQFFERDTPIESHANYVITGLRRAGKSYFLYQLIRANYAQDDIENIVMINFEDERLIEVTSKDLHIILDAYYELYEGASII